MLLSKSVEGLKFEGPKMLRAQGAENRGQRL